jgi:hypothetical protein
MRARSSHFVVSLRSNLDANAKPVRIKRERKGRGEAGVGEEYVYY